MAVQPMDNRIGMINYIDYRYSQNKGTTEAGTVFNSSLNKLKSDFAYSSERVDNETVAITGTTGKLTWTPVVKGTVQIAGKTEGTDFQVNYETGEITFNTAPGGDVVVTYAFDNESVRSDFGGAAFTNVPEVELKMNSIPVEARARTLRSYWAFDAQYELQKELTSILS